MKSREWKKTTSFFIDPFSIDELLWNVRVWVCVYVSVCMNVSVHVRVLYIAGCWWLLIVVVSCVLRGHSEWYQHAYALPLEIRKIYVAAHTHTLLRVCLVFFHHEFISSSTIHTFTYIHIHTPSVSLFLSVSFCLPSPLHFVLVLSFSFYTFLNSLVCIHVHSYRHIRARQILANSIVLVSGEFSCKFSM